MVSLLANDAVVSDVPTVFEATSTKVPVAPEATVILKVAAVPAPLIAGAPTVIEPVGVKEKGNYSAHSNRVMISERRPSNSA